LEGDVEFWADIIDSEGEVGPAVFATCRTTCRQLHIGVEYVTEHFASKVSKEIRRLEGEALQRAHAAGLPKKHTVLYCKEDLLRAGWFVDRGSLGAGSQPGRADAQDPTPVGKFAHPLPQLAPPRTSCSARAPAAGRIIAFPQFALPQFSLARSRTPDITDSLKLSLPATVRREFMNAMRMQWRIWPMAQVRKV